MQKVIRLVRRRRWLVQTRYGLWCRYFVVWGKLMEPDNLEIELLTIR
jgi:hypothetical protein